MMNNNDFVINFKEESENLLKEYKEKLNEIKENLNSHENLINSYVKGKKMSNLISYEILDHQNKILVNISKNKSDNNISDLDIINEIISNNYNRTNQKGKGIIFEKGIITKSLINKIMTRIDEEEEKSLLRLKLLRQKTRSDLSSKIKSKNEIRIVEKGIEDGKTKIEESIKKTTEIKKKRINAKKSV